LKPIVFTLLLAMLAFSCKKKVCATCFNVKVGSGDVSDTRQACADTEREAIREAMETVPPDSAAVLKCTVD